MNCPFQIRHPIGGFQSSIPHNGNLLILNPTLKHLPVDASSTSQLLDHGGEYMGLLALLICQRLVSVLKEG